jgi:hypothetical protein
LGNGIAAACVNHTDGEIGHCGGATCEDEAGHKEQDSRQDALR